MCIAVVHGVFIARSIIYAYNVYRSGSERDGRDVINRDDGDDP